MVDIISNCHRVTPLIPITHLKTHDSLPTQVSEFWTHLIIRQTFLRSSSIFNVGINSHYFLSKFILNRISGTSSHRICISNWLNVIYCDVSRAKQLLFCEMRTKCENFKQAQWQVDTIFFLQMSAKK